MGSTNKSVTLAVASAAMTSLAVSCDSETIAAGDSTECRIDLAAPAETGGLPVKLASSNRHLRVPSAASIPEGSTSTGFRIQTDASDGVEHAVFMASAAGRSTDAAISIRPIKPLTLTCEPRHVVPGKSAICNLKLNDNAVSDTQTVQMSVDSTGVKIPSEVTTRKGQDHIRFEAIADPESSAGQVVIEAKSTQNVVRETVNVLARGMLRLAVPTHVAGVPGSPVRFQVSATDGQNLRLSVSMSGEPGTASFNPQTGEFAWVPTTSDLGRHRVIFSATDAIGGTISKTATLMIDSGAPRITALQNGAGASAPSGCTPGSIGRLVGEFLNGNGSRVLVNDSEVRMLASAPDSVDFVCPVLDPGSSLNIAVETMAGLSKVFRTIVSRSAPGILTINRSGTDQALAWRTGSADLSAIPNFRTPGKPVLSGEQLTVLVTGIDCASDHGSGLVSIRLGELAVPVESVAKAEAPGACEIGITIPRGISGDAIPVTLSLSEGNGRIMTSNVASIAVEDPARNRVA